MEIHRLARRHRVVDEDIRHAYEHAVSWVELGDDPVRYLVVGPGRASQFLELVVLTVPACSGVARVLVIHAISLRRATSEEMFGRKD